jgi:diphosphoinositol-polyphosphate diphosphatase
MIVGTVPYRRKEGGGAEFLLIRSRKNDDWILPKGGWEDFETADAGAAREAEEEAGVRGHLGTCLGDWESTKYYFHFFSLEVTHVLEDYLEKDERERRWFSPQEASAQLGLRREDMHRALQLCIARLGTDVGLA